MRSSRSCDYVSPCQRQVHISLSSNAYTIFLTPSQHYKAMSLYWISALSLDLLAVTRAKSNACQPHVTGKSNTSSGGLCAKPDSDQHENPLSLIEGHHPRYNLIPSFPTPSAIAILTHHLSSSTSPFSFPPHSPTPP